MRLSTCFSFVPFACALAVAGCSSSSEPGDSGVDGSTADLGHADSGDTDLGTDSGDVDLGTDSGDVDLGTDSGDTDSGMTTDGGPNCGNGVVDPGETCDPGIVGGIGACPTSCDDGIACTTDTMMGSACTLACTHTAITTPAAGDGCCPPGATTATDADCAATCGNGVVDSGETCDTGIASGAGSCPTTCNDMMACTTDTLVGGGCTVACSYSPITAPAAGDGCCPPGATHATDADCPATTTPTAFRIDSLALISPRPVVNLGGCTDATDPPGLIGMSVNGQFDSNISGHMLNIVQVFRPLDEAASATPFEVQLNADCTAGSPDSCMPGAMPTVVVTQANNMASGTCFAPVAADVNTRAGTPAAYSPTANTVSGACFVTDETTVTFTLVGATIPLTHARLAGHYMGGPPATTLTSGVLTGFLSERQAADISVMLPILGATPLYSLLQTGGASTTNSSGATVAGGCNVAGGVAEDDRDTLPDGTRGFWFFLNFTAAAATWTAP